MPTDTAEALAPRKDAILRAAIEEAKEQGYQWITRDAVARRAGVGAGSVNVAFGTMRELKRSVLRSAVAGRIVEIVAQGLADAHPIAKDAPSDLKQEAARLLVQ